MEIFEALTFLLVAVVSIKFVRGEIIRTCKANEIYVITGRKPHKTNGKTRPYRIIDSGYFFVIPFAETAQKLDLHNHMVNKQLPLVSFEDGDTHDVELTLSFHISVAEKHLEKAIEHFAGCQIPDLKQIATDTAEGVVRTLCSRHLPPTTENEQFNGLLKEEIQNEFETLGLDLYYAKLKLQNEHKQTEPTNHQTNTSEPNTKTS